jgi:hypothetical protein
MRGTRFWARGLGAGVIVVAVWSLVIGVVQAVNLPVYVWERGGIGLATSLGWSLLINLATVWAGFAMVSRRPSRRRAAAIVFILAAASAAYGLGGWFWRAGASSAPAPAWLGTQISKLVLIAGALAYFAATRNDPQMRPRRTAAPVPPAPAETQRLVAAKIVDGPNWREALLASLRESGVQETARHAAWPWVLALIAFVAFGRFASSLMDALMQGLTPALATVGWLVFGLVSLFALGFPVAAIRRRMLQARQRDAEAALQRAGAKRPIFYLRSFALDDAVGRPSVLELFLNFQPANPEQAMTRELRRCGPLIAIGRPDERLPALGAARFYVSNDLWQEKVADVASVARMVIWASGPTPGLQWEITHLVRSLPPQKLVLWAHPHLLDLDADEREAEWASFVDGLGALFPKPLPKPLGAVRFFAFDEDFTPIPFSGRTTALQSAEIAALRDLLRFKEIEPFDRASVARRRTIRRVALGASAAVVAVALAGLAYGLWTWLRPGPPSLYAWNRLAEMLIADERFASPNQPDEVAQRLRATVEGLDGRWFGGDWQDEPPGRRPPLRGAAERYLAAFEAAHSDPKIESAFYARSFLDVASASEAEELAHKLAPVRAALGAAGEVWAGNKAETETVFFAQEIRALIAAREDLLDAEVDVLQLLADHGSAWTREVDKDGAVSLRVSDDDVLARARELAKKRDAAAAAMADAMNGS